MYLHGRTVTVLHRPGIVLIMLGVGGLLLLKFDVTRPLLHPVSFLPDVNVGELCYLVKLVLVVFVELMNQSTMYWSISHRRLNPSFSS